MFKLSCASGRVLLLFTGGSWSRASADVITVTDHRNRILNPEPDRILDSFQVRLELAEVQILPTISGFGFASSKGSSQVF